MQVDDPVQVATLRNSSTLSDHVNCTNVTSLMLPYRPSQYRQYTHTIMYVQHHHTAYNTVIGVAL